MMKKYRNRRTGNIVTVNGILTGKDWERVAEEKKKSTKKNTKAEEGETET